MAVDIIAIRNNREFLLTKGRAGSDAALREQPARRTVA
jgi:hypothetical protein